MNQETIVAVYDTSAHAQAAVRALEEAGIPSSDITHHASETYSGTTGTTAGAELAPRREEPGFWSRLFGTESEDYRRDNLVYDRTVQTGGSVVSVRVADVGRDADRIMQILESQNPVDIEERASSFERSPTVYDTPQDSRALGVAEAGGGFGTSGMTSTAGMGTEGLTGDLSAGRLGTTGMSTGTRIGDDGEVIPLAEEQLVVGKRVVNRGTTRVRRYVVETPVEENVTLHNENVSIERRPATGNNIAADAFTDKTIEVNEVNEEAVVGKTAHVVEEVVVRKQAGDRTETIRDTLRKEQVEVEKVDDTNLRDNSATGTGLGTDIDPATGRKRPL
jgi:uncharacterized protein (TIGR02271 family)